jgi:molybdopterin/thiamine biosynthesis adenylyltransferase
VGLYGQVEICIKNMVAIALPNVDQKRLFRWDHLGRSLATVGIEIKKLHEYKRVNQLRCLNNAIKHSELVGKELAATGWGKADDVIPPSKCHRELSDFSKAASCFSKIFAASWPT